MLHFLLTAALALAPLDLPSAWQTLAYRGIPPNRVEVTGQGMAIHVNRSAGPVVWPLDQPRSVSRLHVRGTVIGSLQTTAGRQGQKGADDFVLRVGLVESGSRRPGFMERRFAAEWVRRLFAMAPAGDGIGRIRFFNLGLSASQIGWARTHPLSDLLYESVVAVPDEHGAFTFTVPVGGPPVLGIWLSADGDDTQSTFSVWIEALELQP